MPVRYPNNAGKPYRPSNGTEGDMFYDQFCLYCKHDNFDHDTCSGGCPILLRTMAHDIGEPEYPSEWKFDSEGRPTCTAFEEE